MNIVNIEIKENRNLVKIEVIAGNGATNDLQYNLRKGEDGWLVVNFRVDGVNMGLGYRNLSDKNENR